MRRTGTAMRRRAILSTAVVVAVIAATPATAHPDLIPDPDQVVNEIIKTVDDAAPDWVALGVHLSLTGPISTGVAAETTFTGTLWYYEADGEYMAPWDYYSLADDVSHRARRQGMPFQQIDLLLDGTLVASTRTDASGFYSADLTVQELGSKTLQAVARSGIDAAPLAEISRQLLVLEPLVQVSAGYSHACGLLADGTGRCWGSNTLGQLGDGTTTNSTSQVGVSGLSQATSISSGGSHSCALRSDGTVGCWGSNAYGQLGDGTNVNRASAVSVYGLSGAISISAGLSHTCALITDGSVRCWGRNTYGQIGDGTTSDRTTPASVAGMSSAKVVSTGGDHTCALMSDKSVRCWGRNDWSQLGDGTQINRTTPVKVQGLPDSTTVDAGAANNCALLSFDKTIRCWGLSNYPLEVKGLREASAISAGSGDACALTADANVKCWDYVYHNVSLIPGLTQVTAISAGYGFACALISDGAATRCWGNHLANDQVGEYGVITVSNGTTLIRQDLI